jgi:hypothetical protein
MAGGEGGWRKGYLFELCWLVLSFIVSPRLRAVVHPIDSSSHLARKASRRRRSAFNDWL